MIDRAMLRVRLANATLSLLGHTLAGPRAALGRLETWLEGMTVLRVGTRVRIKGGCCTDTKNDGGKLATIVDEHEWDDPDYHVIVDGKPYTKSYKQYDYACERGFDVVEYR